MARRSVLSSGALVLSRQVTCQSVPSSTRPTHRPQLPYRACLPQQLCLPSCITSRARSPASQPDARASIHTLTYRSLRYPYAWILRVCFEPTPLMFSVRFPYASTPRTTSHARPPRPNLPCQRCRLPCPPIPARTSLPDSSEWPVPYMNLALPICLQ